MFLFWNGERQTADAQYNGANFIVLKKIKKMELVVVVSAYNLSI